MLIWNIWDYILYFFECFFISRAYSFQITLNGESWFSYNAISKLYGYLEPNSRRGWSLIFESFEYKIQIYRIKGEPQSCSKVTKSDLFNSSRTLNVHMSEQSRGIMRSTPPPLAGRVRTSMSGWLLKTWKESLTTHYRLAPISPSGIAWRYFPSGGPKVVITLSAVGREILPTSKISLFILFLWHLKFG